MKDFKLIEDSIVLINYILMFCCKTYEDNKDSLPDYFKESLFSDLGHVLGKLICFKAVNQDEDGD